MYVKIGAKIKELRKRDDVTQERLAEVLGVTNQAISKWESESGYPDIEYIATIAKFFGVATDFLFDNDTEKNERKPDEYWEVVKRIQNNYFTEIEAARKKAEQASRSRKNILLNMSHEIKTPLNAVIGMADIAADAPDMEKKDDAIQKIKDAAYHLMGVINDMLDFSTIEANKFGLSVTEFVFGEMVEKIVNVVSPRINDKRQKFIFDIAPIPHTLIGDESRLAQVITNLLSNAIKFTKPGGSINLGSRLISEQNGVCRLQISVADTGIGISEEQKPHLFGTFEGEQTKRKFGGTGLGLAIAKAIVELMDGEIWVESEIGKGSVFTFTVKMKSGEIKPQKLSVQKTDFKGRRILLAEHIAINREIILSILKPTLLDIDCVADGTEAVRMFGESPEKY
ncbi:MAG: ATP-binding protein, partial [Oscillospiraceae bacterium]|nr:ATP-binding protein [Oscillospiraceae bacterium]